MANERAKAFVEKHKEIWKFIKFTFTGVSTSVLEMAVYALLKYILFLQLQGVPVTFIPRLPLSGLYN